MESELAVLMTAETFRDCRWPEACTVLLWGSLPAFVAQLNSTGPSIAAATWIRDKATSNVGIMSPFFHGIFWEMVGVLLLNFKAVHRMLRSCCLADEIPELALPLAAWPASVKATVSISAM